MRKQTIKQKLRLFKEKYRKWLLLLFLILGIAFGCFRNFHSDDIEKLSYMDFKKMVYAQQVDTVYLSDAPKIEFKDKDGKQYSTDNPRINNFKEFLLNNEVNTKENKNPRVLSAIKAVADITFLGILCVIFWSLIGKSGTTSINAQDSKDNNLRFNDIAGNEEAKGEMAFLVDFLKNSSKYQGMGARVPKGVLFIGPPGTGKTLMAKAIAGEANVPFYPVNGSDFVELFVGNGARKVRNLFKKARENAPSIIFIDEIDAVGYKRGGANSNPEGDQTLNALLSELDGFNGTEGVVVIAGTNLPDKLDPALIRPGRFDKKITIGLPDLDARTKILELHAKNKKISSEVDFAAIAKMTIGFSGAALESLLNEAALTAAQENQVSITSQHIDNALLKVVCQGDIKKNRGNRSKEEVALVAWHEAGHALCTKLISAQSVPKVTITPMTSGAGGLTLISPSKENLQSKIDLYNAVMIRYAGRIGEYLLYNNPDKITTGASEDIKSATEYIKNIVVNFGMSKEFGMLNLSALGVKDEVITDAAVTLSRELYDKTLDILTRNKSKLKLIAEALIEKETINEEELDFLISDSTQIKAS